MCLFIYFLSVLLDVIMVLFINKWGVFINVVTCNVKCLIGV
jgi:hypothetical protein